MRCALKNRVANASLSLLCLLSFLSLQALALPVWRTPEVVAHSNKNLGCIYGCTFGHDPHTHLPSNSTSNSRSDYLLTTNSGEPIRLPQLSAGHFLVIPIAAVAAIGYHIVKLRTGKPLS